MVRGSSGNGLTRDGGCWAVNCANSHARGSASEAQIYAVHPGIANALRCDGSVLVLKDKIATTVLAGLATRSNGESVTVD